MNTDEHLLYLVDEVAEAAIGLVTQGPAVLEVSVIPEVSGNLQVDVSLTNSDGDIAIPPEVTRQIVQMHHGFAANGKLWQRCRMQIESGEDGWFHEVAFDPEEPS